MNNMNVYSVDMNYLRDLNNLLLEQKELYCAKCERLLTPPVMLIEHEGNICGRCYQHRPPKVIRIRNNALEFVILNLIINCRFRKNGCFLQLPFTRMAEHEEYCVYRPMDCISIEECRWRGPVKQMDYHFDLVHKRYVLRPDFIPKKLSSSYKNEISYTLKIDLTKNKNIHVLLTNSFERFLLQIEIEGNQMWYAVCYVGDPELCKKFMYRLEKIMYKKTYDFCKKIEAKPLLPEYQMGGLERKDSVEISLDVVKKKVKKINKVSFNMKIYDYRFDIPKYLKESR